MKRRGRSPDMRTLDDPGLPDYAPDMRTLDDPAPAVATAPPPVPPAEPKRGLRARIGRAFDRVMGR